VKNALTPRQLAICHRIADGWQNKEIAREEEKSIVSVKHQIMAIMAATGIRNRAGLAAWYVRQQLEQQQ
jgi:DNA-binding NarL/FixJ family response regulator